MNLNSLRLDDPAIIADPFPTYALLREEHPVFRYEPLRCWLISRAADIRQLLKDARVSAGGRRYTKGIDIFPKEVRDRFRPLSEILAMMMLFHDPPEHTRLRRHLNAPFNARHTETLREHIQSTAEALIDEFPADVVDIVADFARPLPGNIICELLDVPSSDRRDLIHASDDLADFFVAAPPSIEQLERAQASTLRMMDYFEGRLGYSGSSGTTAVLSLLRSFRNDSTQLSIKEMAAQCILLMFGGQETVRNTISLACYCLLKHPAQLSQAMQQSELVSAAVGEVLRWQSPVQFIGRTAKESITLHDKTIQAGEPLLLLLGSANRDPQLHPEPDRFNILRQQNTSAFGHGSHKCLGEWLARIEAETALKALFAQIPSLRMGEEAPVWLPHLALRGFISLNLKRE